MDGFVAAMDDMLASFYRNMLRLEKQEIQKSRQPSLTISEVHLILCIGDSRGEGRTVTALARLLNITVSSATIAVNKLGQKGYVKKVKGSADGRIVRVYLTEQGKSVDTYHRICRRDMIKEISRGFTPEERKIAVKVINRLNEYFVKNVDDTF